MSTTTTTVANRTSFPTAEVLESDGFFWVGRGGFGITHSGNMLVRSLIGGRATEYANLKRAQRGGVARSLLSNELEPIKFVVPRDTVLANMDEDDKKEAQGTLRTRQVSMLRRRSVLQRHGGIDQIRAFPSGHCIEVGFPWMLDIVSHQLREDAKTNQKQQQQQTGKRKRKATTCSTPPPPPPPPPPVQVTPEPSAFQDIEDFHRVFDDVEQDQGIDNFFSSLYPPAEEQSMNAKRQKTTALPETTTTESIADFLPSSNSGLFSSVDMLDVIAQTNAAPLRSTTTQQPPLSSLGSLDDFFNEQEEQDMVQFFDGIMFNKSTESIDEVASLAV